MLVASISIFDPKKGQLESALINWESLDSLIGATLEFLNETYGREIKIIKKQTMVIDERELIEVQFKEGDNNNEKNRIDWDGQVYFDESIEKRDPSFWQKRPKKNVSEFENYPDAFAFSNLISDLIGTLGRVTNHSNVECIVV